MSFIPEDELKPKLSMTFAPPMIDFLFLMLAFFACLAVSRSTTKDTDIDLVKIQSCKASLPTNAELDYKVININIDKEGRYKWVTEFKDYPLTTPDEITLELNNQYTKGLMPKNKLKTQVLLKIDRDTKWESIFQAIFAIKDAGFEVRPVYEPIEKQI